MKCEPVQLKNIPEKWTSKAIMLMIQNNLDYAVANILMN
jgi:urocanate hydratase